MRDTEREREFSKKKREREIEREIERGRRIKKKKKLPHKKRNVILGPALLVANTLVDGPVKDIRNFFIFELPVVHFGKHFGPVFGGIETLDSGNEGQIREDPYRIVLAIIPRFGAYWTFLFSSILPTEEDMVVWANMIQDQLTPREG